MKREIRIAFVLLLLLSCNQVSRTLAPADYVRYMESDKSGMRKEIETEATTYTIQLATPEYVASKDFDHSPGSSSKIHDRINELKGTLFFLIAIKSKKPENEPINSNEKAMYYEAQVSQDIILRTKSAYQRPIVCHYENNLGLSPSNTLIAGFNVNDSVKDDLQIVYNDRYTKDPMIQASFLQKDISSLPQLTIR